MERQAAELAEDEKALEAKIKKKQAELARNQKRLESLASVRPAFMDEYEKLEIELADEYEAYVTRYRNLDYLQHELDEHNKREKEKVEASSRALKRLQKRLRDEDNRAFRGDENVDDDDGVISPQAAGCVLCDALAALACSAGGRVRSHGAPLTLVLAVGDRVLLRAGRQLPLAGPGVHQLQQLAAGVERPQQKGQCEAGISTMMMTLTGKRTMVRIVSGLTSDARSCLESVTCPARCLRPSSYPCPHFFAPFCFFPTSRYLKR
jgi:hypothetical protein